MSQANPDEQLPTSPGEPPPPPRPPRPMTEIEAAAFLRAAAADPVFVRHFRRISSLLARGAVPPLTDYPLPEFPPQAQPEAIQDARPMLKALVRQSCGTGDAYPIQKRQECIDADPDQNQVCHCSVLVEGLLHNMQNYGSLGGVYSQGDRPAPTEILGLIAILYATWVKTNPPIRRPVA